MNQIHEFERDFLDAWPEDRAYRDDPKWMAFREDWIRQRENEQVHFDNPKVHFLDITRTAWAILGWMIHMALFAAGAIAGLVLTLSGDQVREAASAVANWTPEQSETVGFVFLVTWSALLALLVVGQMLSGRFWYRFEYPSKRLIRDRMLAWSHEWWRVRAGIQSKFFAAQRIL